MDCIFCKIAKGEIPSAKVYENDRVFAFMDIAPINEGHVLVIPKSHHETILDIDEETLSKVIKVVKRCSSAVKTATVADGINVSQNNYKAAGQVVPHLHFHVIPRFSGDGLESWPHKSYEGDGMKSIALRIAKLL